MLNTLRGPQASSQHNKNFDKFIKVIPSTAQEINPKAKISIFGVNSTSVDILASLILKLIPVELYVFDDSETKLDTCIMDFQYFKSINSNLSLHCSTDIKKTENSDICIICFLENRNENSFYLNLDDIILNINLYKKYIPKIVKYSPNTIIIVATHPFSVMTYYCLKFSKLPDNRVLGIGSSIATAVCRQILSKYFDISVNDIYGWVSTFLTLEDLDTLNSLKTNPCLLWSTVMIAGVNIDSIVDLTFKENYDLLNKLIFDFGKYYADYDKNCRIVPIIGTVCYELCQCILTDSQIAISLSCNIKGYFGIQYTAFLGLPCIVGRNGYMEIVKMILSDTDMDSIRHGAICNYKILKLIDAKLKSYNK